MKRGRFLAVGLAAFFVGTGLTFTSQRVNAEVFSGETLVQANEIDSYLEASGYSAEFIAATAEEVKTTIYEQGAVFESEETVTSFTESGGNATCVGVLTRSHISHENYRIKKMVTYNWSWTGDAKNKTSEYINLSWEDRLDNHPETMQFVYRVSGELVHSDSSGKSVAIPKTAEKTVLSKSGGSGGNVAFTDSVMEKNIGIRFQLYQGDDSEYFNPFKTTFRQTQESGGYGDYAVMRHYGTYSTVLSKEWSTPETPLLNATAEYQHQVSQTIMNLGFFPFPSFLFTFEKYEQTGNEKGDEANPFRVNASFFSKITPFTFLKLGFPLPFFPF